MTMEYKEAVYLIEGALKDIDQAERFVLDAHAADNTANYAAIAQAKILAVIAETLAEMNKRDKDRYINQP